MGNGAHDTYGRRTSLASALVLALALSSAATARAQPTTEVTAPVVVSHVDAAYPPSALAARKDADVVVALTIDADGHVTKVDVVTSGGADLDEAAVVAARQWTFAPATRAGKPVASRIRVPFHFSPPAPPPDLVESKEPDPTRGGVSAPAPAAPPAALPVASDDDEVKVGGRRAPPSRGASDFNLRVGELRNVPRANASELLKLAPGILLTNEGGEGHAEQVFLRGFDAREGQDIEFSVGGVPINESGNLHGNGVANTHFIIPELVKSLRVVEGPFDPRQGNYAVAGSANYELGLEKRGLTAKYLGGSFGTQRLLLTWGPEHQSTGTFGGVEIYSTDGYGQNRDAKRASAMAQYEGKVGEKGSFRVTGTAYSTTFHSAGVLRDDDVRSGKKGFYDTYDFGQGGDSSRFSLAGDVESRSGSTTFTEQLFLISNTSRLRENFTGYLLDVQTPLQEPHPQRGDLLDLNVTELTIGSKGAAHLRGKAFGQNQELELGYFARGDHVNASQQRLAAVTNHPYATEANLESQLGDLGLYGDVDLHATKWLGFRGGARADLFTFNVLDNCAVHGIDNPSKTSPPGDASCLNQEDFGKHRESNQRSSTASTAVLPRGSIILGPWSGVTFSGSYGQGVRSIDPSYITQDIKTPFASVTAYEGGAAYAGEFHEIGLVARSVLFQTHVDKDLIFSETEGRNVLGVGTTRTGWAGSLRATGSFFDESANITFVRSTYDDTHLLVAYVPNVVVRSDTSIFTDFPWRVRGEKIRGTLSAGVTYVGKRALPYGEVSDTIFTVDSSATLSWTRYELGLIATNLFDRRYRLGEYNYVSSFQNEQPPTLVPMRHFAAGAPRGIFGTFAINFGGP